MMERVECYLFDVIYDFCSGNRSNVPDFLPPPRTIDLKVFPMVLSGDVVGLGLLAVKSFVIF